MRLLANFKEHKPIFINEPIDEYISRRCEFLAGFIQRKLDEFKQINNINFTLSLLGDAAYEVNNLLCCLEEDEKSTEQNDTSDQELTDEQREAFRSRLLAMAYSLCDFLVGRQINSNELGYDEANFILENLAAKLAQYNYGGSQK